MIKKFSTLVLLICFFSVLSAEDEKSANISAFQTYTSFAIIPYAQWFTGDFSDLIDDGTDPLLSIDMENSAFTTYQGDILFNKIGIKLGLSFNVDDTLIGKIQQFVGYLNWQGFSLRVQNAELNGTIQWEGVSVPGASDSFSFSNTFSTIDLLYYPVSSSFYFGIGYTSYMLPVQLECLSLSSTGSGAVVGVLPVYQEDMAFGIYSFLFGFDTLSSGIRLNERGNTGQWVPDGFFMWAATQDRFGGGTAEISEEGKQRIETVNKRKLVTTSVFTMIVDYELTLGLQYVKRFSYVHLGCGVGYSFGGQMLLSISGMDRGGLTSALEVAATPNLYLAHHGPILQVGIAW